MIRGLSTLLAVLLVGAGGLNGGMVVGQEGYETPPVSQASELLPAEMLRGDNFEVTTNVTNDGFMNLYEVTSKYGEFTAYGDLELVKLIHQVDAIAELDKVSATDQFLDAAGHTVTDQLDTAKNVAQHPVEITKALPKGIFHMFRKYKVAAETGVHAATALAGDDDKETDPTSGYAEVWAAVTDTERDWYHKLELDPYHHNEVLREAVSHVAKVDVIASVGMSFAPVPSIPGASYLGEVTEAVWTTDPSELREQNIERLQATGIGDELIGRFMDNGFISPTQQTLTATALGQLEGVDGLEVLLEISARADSLELAQLDIANTMLLAAYHREVAPLATIFPGAPVPVAMDSAGGLVILVSADYAFWVDDLAPVLGIMAERFADRDAASREIWLRGKASPRFVTEVGDLGWTVRQSIDLKAGAKRDLAKLP